MIQGLKESNSNEKLPLFLIRMLFSYFNNKIENKDVIDNIRITDDKDKKKEKENNKKLINVLKSLSTDNNTNNEINIVAENQISKSPTKSSTYSKTNKKNANNIEAVPMDLDDQMVNAIHLTEDEPQKKDKKNSAQQKKKLEKEKN